MALPYSCLRQLTKSQGFRNVRSVFQKPTYQTSNQISATRVFCQFINNKQSCRMSASRLFSRGFRTKRTVEGEKPRVPGPDPESPSLLRPFLYTVGVVGCSFTGAMIWNYEKMRKIFRDLQNGTRKESQKQQGAPKRFGFRDHLNSMWTNLSSGQLTVLFIFAANVVVFLLWRVPALQPSMIRYFTTAARHPLPSMTLSSFSHISFLHLFVNMYVLWSFASVAVNLFGYEQFSAFYLSAGTISSFASLAASKLLRRPASVSVGASGAILGLIGAVCITHPNAQLSIAFISEIFPHSFSANTGMKAIIVFDLLGLFLGWRLLDHAGHLGGILFGILYTKYGSKHVWGNRETIMRWWHNVRGKP